MNTILTGICLLLTLAFQAETNYRRTAQAEEQGMPESQFSDLQGRLHFSKRAAVSVTGWYDRDTTIWRFFLRPLLLLRLPAVLWGSLTYGIVLGVVVFQATANSVAFPQLYGFSPIGVGNLNIANLIGAVIGCIYGGPVSDWVVHRISKRRMGYFMPEYRLWCLVPPFLLGPVGLLLWGCGLGNHLNAYVAIAGSGLTYGVLCAVPAIGITYVVDSYKPLSADTITVLTAFKNTFAFGVSFAVAPWSASSGFVKVSGYLTLIEGVLFASTILIFIYGARLRAWTSNSGSLTAHATLDGSASANTTRRV